MSDPWWRSPVVYQVYPRSFRDSNGDGIGDLPGLVAGLDHIASLGVDAIWISPFYRSPMRDFGYDVSDHIRVDPQYGSFDDALLLIDEIKRRGMRVIFDLVLGHTSNRHAWFQESRASNDNPKADWYIWADPKPDGMAPNNWLGVFGGSAWAWDPVRRQYYLHHFLREQPALNLRNEDVVQAQLDVADFWLRRGVDGLRLDAVDFFAHDPALRDNPPLLRPGAPAPSKLFAAQRHDHDMLHPDGDILLRRLRTLADRHGVPLLGETSSQPGAFERIARLAGPQGPLHAAYTLAPLRRGFDAQLAGELIDHAARPGNGLCWATGNHDVPRFATRCAGPDGRPDYRALAMRAAFLLCLAGPACLYQGDELGLPESELAEEDLRDPFGLHYWPAFAGRDGCRTPMPWREFEAHGGFSSQKPWLPLDPAHRELAVDAQEDDPGSVLSMWRGLLSWRRCTFDATCRNVLRISSFAPALAFLREGRSGPLLCAFNFEGRDISLASGVLRGARVSRADHARLGGETLGFAPNGWIVLELDPSAARALGCDKLRAR